jgi:inner membrane transporter RhtA
LFTKEFSVSTAPEVGRIIDILNLPSSTDFAFLSEALNFLLYIDAAVSNAQYIAQRQINSLVSTLDDAI